jgi:hypothetical protein
MTNLSLGRRPAGGEWIADALPLSDYETKPSELQGEDGLGRRVER